MDDKNKNPKPQWKECIVFGVINVLLVLLCTKLKVTMINVLGNILGVFNGNT